jgi:carotenoid cleavage dioxygenase-like enzyme
VPPPAPRSLQTPPAAAAPRPGEPLFVASPQASAEDDGVVLVPGVGAGGGTFVAVLDAQSWAELGRAEMPFSTPYRFHGIFLGGKQAAPGAA